MQKSRGTPKKTSGKPAGAGRPGSIPSAKRRPTNRKATPVQGKTPRAQAKPAAGPMSKPAAPPARKLSAGERRGAQMLLAILTVSAAVYLVLVVSIALFVWYSFSSTPKSETLYALHLLKGDGDDVKRMSTYSVQQANNSYGLYLRYSDLAPLCGFGIAGDAEQITLFLPAETTDGAGSILCSRNSSLVQINGTTVRLPAPILFEETDYLLPVSLFEGYLQGLHIEYDEKKQICRVTVPTNPVFLLKLHKPEVAQPCDVSGISVPDNSSDPSGDTSSTTS